MIQKLQSKNFRINDPEIEETMRRKCIDHLRFNVVLEDELLIIVEYPDYDNILSFDKSWFKVHWGKKIVSVRTPSILRSHVGKEIEVYVDNVFKKQNELFRIRPIGFNLIENFKRKRRRVGSSAPYFSKSGRCIIPRRYIRDKNLIKILTSKISFNRINSYLIDKGFIFASITKKREPGRLSYPLNECSNGVRTRRLTGVLDIIFDSGKNITDFQYLKTIFDKNYEYDLIIFKEVKFNGS